MSPDEHKVKTKKTAMVEDNINEYRPSLKGYFKPGENSVTNLSCKTQKLARILEEDAYNKEKTK
jgi:hypothetical protein